MFSMAGTESSKEKPVFRLKLFVDKEKNKVVLAEVGKDFVDVLFSLLILPMGTIVRLLQKHEQNQAACTIGCFNNLYKSVVDMSNDDFLTEACKHILLYPMHAKERQCKRLKLNIDDTEVMKFYRCPDSGKSQSCSKAYSNFCSLKCICGKFMSKEIRVFEVGGKEIFVSEKKSFISDNMKVGVSSISLTLKTLRELGYTDLDKLDDVLVDVCHKEVLALLECLFSSDTPLTDAFLNKRSSCTITKTHNMPSLALQNNGGKAESSSEAMSVTVFVRKQDKKVLYAESGQDFVDSLLIFLAIPLEAAWEISRTNIEMGCIDNFYTSMKSLRSSSSTSKLPANYNFQTSLLDVCSKVCSAWTVPIHSQSYDLKLMYPNYDGSSESTVHGRSGLVKKGTTYMISDDLTISSANSSSTISILKKWNVDLDDIEEHVINITKTEAIGLLRASLMTSTALTTALGSLLLKKPKDEKL
ncbi:unnamed protein product [Thlaspi arvense]|uniref:DUF674 family protein n=1 Tax=Thlaspi arvense TaxID=13288 RepID=A0AAU9RW74_THLAR|nr:unnamed protein product [Thlaspi arvense]